MSGKTEDLSFLWLAPIFKQYLQGPSIMWQRAGFSSFSGPRDILWYWWTIFCLWLSGLTSCFSHLALVADVVLHICMWTYVFASP